MINFKTIKEKLLILKSDFVNIDFNDKLTRIDKCENFYIQFFEYVNNEDYLKSFLASKEEEFGKRKQTNILIINSYIEILGYISKLLHYKEKLNEIFQLTFWGALVREFVYFDFKYFVEFINKICLKSYFEDIIKYVLYGHDIQKYKIKETQTTVEKALINYFNSAEKHNLLLQKLTDNDIESFHYYAVLHCYRNLKSLNSSTLPFFYIAMNTLLYNLMNNLDIEIALQNQTLSINNDKVQAFIKKEKLKNAELKYFECWCNEPLIPNKELADRLSVSPGTIETYKTTILQKLRVYLGISQDKDNSKGQMNKLLNLLIEK